MTAALLDRPTIATNGCRFSDWCEGIGETSRPAHGERSHWSAYTGEFWAYDVHERIGVQLYGYENDRDGIDPVRVYLAIGDHDCDEDGITLPVDSACALGTALRDFQPKRPAYEDALVFAVNADGAERVVTAEFRRERSHRQLGAQGEHIEFSMRPDSTRRYSIRVRLDLATSRRLGRCLVEEADRAAASNCRYGLVAK